MGQKTSPLIIKNNYNSILLDINYNKEIAFLFLLRKFLINYFKKKGIEINSLKIIKSNNNMLIIEATFIISRNALIYGKRFRKNFKKKKKKRLIISSRLAKKKIFKYAHIRLKQNISKKAKLRKMLINIAKITKVNKILLKFIRLDKKISKKLLKLVMQQGFKIGLHFYKNTPQFKNIMVATSLLLSNKQITSNLILTLISKAFERIPKRSQKRFFIFLRNFFRLLLKLDKIGNNNLIGIKLNLNGKVNGKTKATELNWIIGKLSLQTIKNSIDFCKLTTFTRWGTYGWKLYIMKNNDTKKNKVQKISKTKIAKQNKNK